MKPTGPWKHPLLVPLGLLACALPARAEVWIVQGGGFGSPPPGADFAQIYQAVAAAAEGDTLVVRDGTYRVFSILGKSLTVVGDGANVFVDGSSPYGPGGSSIIVRDLSAGQEVVVRGLRTNYGLHVSNCVGPVWFDEVRCLGTWSPCATGTAPGAQVTGSLQVTFTRCTFRGEVADSITFTSGAGSAGFQTSSSAVQLFDCTITGAAGPSEWQTGAAPQPGAPGLRLESSTVTLVGCTIEGGAGGGARGNLCEVVHAPGGPGLEFVGTGSTVRSAESTAVGGVLSLEPLCPGLSGPQGQAISGTGTIIALPGFARHLRANSPVRGGETLTFELAGQPGEVPLVLVSLVHEPRALFNGSLLVGLPVEDLFVLPPLPASGAGTLAFPVPNVGAVESLSFYAQAAFLDPALTVWLGAGTTVVLLDSAL